MRKSAAHDENFRIYLGKTAAGADLALTRQELAAHGLLCGPTGCGKSKLMELMAIQLAFHGQGLTLNDKDGTTADDVLTRLVELRDRLSIFEQLEIYHLKPSWDHLWSYDPSHSPFTGRQYDAWLAQRVESVARVLGRKQGIADFKDQMRRHRVLTDVLYMVLTRGPDGNSIGLHRALDVLDLMGSGEWWQLFNRVCERLPREVAADLVRLQRMRSEYHRNQETESTRNILRAFLSPLVKEMLARKAPPIDFAECVRRRSILLVSLAETPFFSSEQGDAIAAMVINDIIDACWAVQEPHYLFVEEAATVLGDDFGKVLDRARKRGLSMVASVQSLAGLKNRFSDIEVKALTQPGFHVTFQQKTDLDTWAELFATSGLDFTLDWRPMDRPDGYDWHVVPETSVSQSRQTTWSTGSSVTSTEGQGGSSATSRSVTDGASDSNSLTDAASRSRTRGTSKSNNQTQSRGSSIRDGESETFSDGASFTDGASESDSAQAGRSRSRGLTRGVSRSLSTGRTAGSNWSRSVASGRTRHDGGSETTGRSVSNRHIPLARHREEWFCNGLLLPLDVQYAIVKKALRTLGRGQIMAAIANRPTVLADVLYVPDPFAARPRWGQAETQYFLEWTWRMHHCFFTPTECEKWVRRRGTGGSSGGSTTRKRCE